MSFENDTNAMLFKRLRSGDTCAKAEIIENNLPLVKSIAKRYICSSTIYEDLFQVGTVGLIKAVDGFDESLGFAFSTYAFTLISGEIKRYLRDDGIIKVSRLLKKNAATVLAAKEEYFSSFGKEPSLTELTRICGLSAEEITECLDAACPVRSISEPLCDGTELTLGDSISQDDGISKLIDRVTLSKALTELDKDDRLLIQLRFFRNLTQTQTAKLMGISQVTVSRQEKRIIEKLRSQLVL